MSDDDLNPEDLPDEFEVGVGIGEDLMADLARFIEERIGGVLLLAAEKGADIRPLVESIAKQLRDAADALEDGLPAS